MINHLSECNPHITIHSITDPAFSKYGKVLTGFDFTECIEIMKNRAIPEEGNIYVACDEDMMNTAVASELSQRFYAYMPIQIGYCNGNSFKLNALEYHKGTEIDVAVTDLVLLLGDTRNIINNNIDSSNIEAFYVPANTVCELYSTTLHFAPCKTSSKGFKSIIVLPYKTNSPLETLPQPKCDEDHLLWMQNKWLIAHTDSIPASKGAYTGITGDNIEIKF